MKNEVVNLDDLRLIVGDKFVGDNYHEMLLAVLAPLLIWGRRVVVCSPNGLTVASISLPEGLVVEGSRELTKRFAQQYGILEAPGLPPPPIALSPGTPLTPADLGPNLCYPRMSVGEMRDLNERSALEQLAKERERDQRPPREAPGTRDVGDGVIEEIGPAITVTLPDRGAA